MLQSGNTLYGLLSSLGMEDADAIKKLAKDAVDWYQEVYNDKISENAIMPVMLNYEFIWDQKPVQNCGPFMEKWNSIEYIKADGKKRIAVNLPKIVYGTADEFFNQGIVTTEVKKTILGERPNTWIYIHGASHQKTLKASREGDIFITQAEKFATANALIDDSFTNILKIDYKRLGRQRYILITVLEVREDILRITCFFKNICLHDRRRKSILDNSLSEIARKINFNQGMGIPIVVFNSLSWERADPVTFELNFDRNQAKGISLVDSENIKIPLQLSQTEYFDDGYLKSANIRFLANNLSSIGYKTYYLKTNDEPLNTNNVKVDDKVVENKFYRVTFGNGGLESIYDKELGNRIDR